MKSLISRGSLFELANMKSQLVVEVNVQTKPNNDLINTVILGVISSSIGGVVDLISTGGSKQKVLLKFKNFIGLYSGIIAPSISDEGNTRYDTREDKFEVVYGSCNNIVRIFPKLGGIAGMDNTNVEIITTIKQIRGNNVLDSITTLIGKGLIK